MAAEKKTATPTEYTILRLGRLDQAAQRTSDADSCWLVVSASVMATSATGAIRQVAAKLTAEAQAGVFVAVPARSWKPTKVAPKTTVQLELTEVKP